jgi:hypothetical protein
MLVVPPLLPLFEPKSLYIYYHIQHDAHLCHVSVISLLHSHSKMCVNNVIHIN